MLMQVCWHCGQPVGYGDLDVCKEDQIKKEMKGRVGHGGTLLVKQCLCRFCRDKGITIHI
jgi:hypothetical protein